MVDSASRAASFGASEAASPGASSSADDTTQPYSQADQTGAGGPAQPAGWATRLEGLGLRLTRGPGSTGPLRREIDGSLLGGVAAGIAKRTGFDAGMIRAVIVVFALVTTGFGAAVYVVAWLLIPAAGAESSIGTKALRDKRGLGLA
ncbi:MAG TPA: PspC domain-containing protein, partial [Streptosporangiaceae bacterium]|nr:PspC domain-containing protein [Streptosporangiaceae bacterium]